MNNPVKQHWVPQFYLKYFSTPETRRRKYPQVWIFSKDSGEPQLSSVRKICSSANLYSPINDQGERTYEIEKDISEIEHLLSQIWPSLANEFVDFETNPSIKKGVSLFLSIMHLRHPDVRKEGEKLHKKIVKLYDQLPKDACGRPNVQGFEINGNVHQLDTSDWFDYKKWDINEHHRFFASSIKSQAGNLAKILLGKRWSVLFSEEPVFITSDKPLAKLHETKKVFGFGTEGTTIYFPLSPTRLLVIDDKHEEPAGQYYPLIKDNIGPINLLTFRNSKTFMISHRNTYEILSEIVGWADEYEKNNV